MEAVYTALIALASAVIVKTLDLIFAKATEKKGAIANLTKKVEDIGTKLDSHISEDEKSKAIHARQRILRADDEIRHGVLHSKEFFDSVLEDDIKFYQEYCNTHPEFPNAVALSAINNIMRVYEKCKAENSFL
jgi:hypothetical protein